jgi:hypothetical protein
VETLAGRPLAVALRGWIDADERPPNLGILHNNPVEQDERWLALCRCLLAGLDGV